MSKISQQAIENALMRALIRSMAGVIVDMIDHSANLNNWKASYHLVKMHPYTNKKPAVGSLAEKHLLFANHYGRILSILDEATAFLEGQPLRRVVEAGEG